VRPHLKPQYGNNWPYRADAIPERSRLLIRAGDRCRDVGHRSEQDEGIILRGQETAPPPERSGFGSTALTTKARPPISFAAATHRSSACFSRPLPTPPPIQF
jgi:hypothetical protein